MQVRIPLLPLLPLLLLFAACLDNDGGPGWVAARLRGCGLLGNGLVYANARSELDTCLLQCRQEASCAELRTRYCKQTSTGQLLDCESECLAPIACDSHKRSYTLLERCDGEHQCRDGSDEQGCRGFEQAPGYCGSGERIWTYQRCNGVEDCKDHSDELGCPDERDQFVCKGKVPQRVPRSRVCDLVDDCVDGSDESATLGCAQLSCR
jgi:hypothetical protein